MTIPNKDIMLELLLAGKLGNHTPVWWKLEDLKASGFPGPVAIRYKMPGNVWERGRPTAEIPQRVLELKRCGLSEWLMFFHAWPPDGTLALNFEVVRSENYIELYWSRNANLNAGETQHYTGAQAMCFLRWYIGDESLDALKNIWDDFPTCVIHCTYHTAPTGLNGDRLVVWEARDY
jgi:hypothetical protein